MPAGRPSKIDQVVRYRADGSPVTAAQQIIDRVQIGMDFGSAAASAGVARSTFYEWRLNGARARALIAQGHEVSPTDLAMAEFTDSLESAESNAEFGWLAGIQRAARGGYTTTTVTERHDAEGKLVEKVTVTKEAEPLWTANAWLLERRRGYVKRYEVTGADGSPLVAPDDAARGLADALRAYLVGRQDAQAEVESASHPQAIEVTAT